MAALPKADAGDENAQLSTIAGDGKCFVDGECHGDVFCSGNVGRERVGTGAGERLFGDRPAVDQQFYRGAPAIVRGSEFGAQRSAGSLDDDRCFGRRPAVGREAAQDLLLIDGSDPGEFGFSFADQVGR